jgi:hypothetical protein
VIAIPGVRRPQALGFKTDEIKRTIRVGEYATRPPPAAGPRSQSTA